MAESTRMSTHILHRDVKHADELSSHFQLILLERRGLSWHVYPVERLHLPPPTVKL